MKLFNLYADFGHGDGWEKIDSGLNQYEARVQEGQHQVANRHTRPRPKFRIKDMSSKEICELTDYEWILTFGGGNVQYYRGSSKPSLFIRLYSSTTYGQLFERMTEEFQRAGLPEATLDDAWYALAKFYYQQVKGRKGKTFAKMTADDRRNFEEEGSTYVFELVK